MTGALEEIQKWRQVPPLQEVRQALTEDAVINDDLQRPRLQQICYAEAHGAQAGQQQAPFDLTQVRRKDLTQSRPIAMLHVYRNLEIAISSDCASSNAARARSASCGTSAGQLTGSRRQVVLILRTSVRPR